MKRCLLLLLALGPAGCGDMPRDVDGTLDRVRASHVIRVGHVAGASAADDRNWRRIVARLAARTGAAPAVTGGALEPLLLDLEAGRLDLVVGGRFAEKSPWTPRVTLGPPIATRETAAGKTSGHVVARNGENAWIMLVEREVRARD